MLGIGAYKQRMVDPTAALPGRDTAMPLPHRHTINGQPLRGEWSGLETIQFGMGCFWGAERKFWSIPGVVVTAVGYAGGYTPNPTYEETCSGMTGHTEAVLVVYDPAVVPLEALLKVFWENHDPTQGMRQGNDRGTQYRSAIYASTPQQLETAQRSREAFQQALKAAGHSGEITTEIAQGPEFFYAEDYHQQYLAKNPNGYCGLGGTGVSCPIGLATA
jgi:peptide-methionine (S)-S-oxide reductase